MLVLVNTLVLFVAVANGSKAPTVIPLKYTLQLVTDIEKGLTAYSGNVTIEVKVEKDDTSIIFLNMQGLEITKVDVFNDTSHFIPDNFVVGPPNNEVITLRTNAFLSTGVYTIEMSFRGNLRNDSLGFFSSVSGKENIIAATNFHSSFARYAFPCFDDPQFLVEFNLEIQHNKFFSAISSTKGKIFLLDDEYAVTVFEKTDLIPIHAFGFAVQNYRDVGPNNMRIAHRVYAERLLSIDGKTTETLDQTDAIINLFYDLLGPPTIENLNQIIINDFIDSPYGFDPCTIMLGNQRHLINDDDKTSNGDKLADATRIIATKYSVNYD
jgi:cytosol alanyl aminopeptidase